MAELGRYPQQQDIQQYRQTQLTLLPPLSLASLQQQPTQQQATLQSQHSSSQWVIIDESASVASPNSQIRTNGNNNVLPQPIIKVPFPPQVNPEELITKQRKGKIPTKPPNAFMIYRMKYVEELHARGYRLPMRDVSASVASSWKDEPEMIVAHYEEIARETSKIYNHQRTNTTQSSNQSGGFLRQMTLPPTPPSMNTSPVINPHYGSLLGPSSSLRSTSSLQNYSQQQNNLIPSNYQMRLNDLPPLHTGQYQNFLNDNSNAQTNWDYSSTTH
ncbi:12438_t:CDS:2 [Ambispora leptoticha]|uniref:12438_t:CDS:1 n=1 Tax=Ambispora leptoticha TaxID=144679 RepID=A0A9N8ZGD1_9GLOM|nr:12438_t:CDS:2 [Ambispora leptoticha]